MNEETTALLRVIVYIQNNTAFGGQVPTVPQPWTGPPHRIVQVQAILLASLFTSLLSAFLAMLGKQWLNRCMPVDTRGTIIQRNQHRQRKFDGIRNWYFDNVMEALPLMLQVALLLLGCALSRYLWDINTTVASVVLGITAFGVLFYAFIVIAGAVSENCPYQTPAANFIRRIPAAVGRTPGLLRRSIQGVIYFIQVILHHISHIFRSIQDALNRVLSICRHLLTLHELRSHFSILLEISNTLGILRAICWSFRYPDLSDAFTTLLSILTLPVWPIVDLCRAMIWVLNRFTNWVHQVQPEQHAEQTTGQQIVGHVLDLRCVLWTLQTSVDALVRQSALDYLATITMNDSNPTQVVASWFSLFLNCVQVTSDSVAIIQGYESLAERLSLSFLHTLSHVMVTDPLPEVLEDIQQQFTGTFPSETKFRDLPVSRTLGIIHSIFCSNHFTRSLPSQAVRWRVQWNNYQPSSSEYATVTPALVKFAQFGYKGSGWRPKVPRWLLRFTLHSLSQDPLPPPSVVSDSLSIIAIDLGCGELGAVTRDPLDRR